jgi:hypothetical protein
MASAELPSSSQFSGVPLFYDCQPPQHSGLDRHCLSSLPIRVNMWHSGHITTHFLPVLFQIIFSLRVVKREVIVAFLAILPHSLTCHIISGKIKSPSSQDVHKEA